MLQQRDFYKRFRRRFLKLKEICHKEKRRILLYVDEKKHVYPGGNILRNIFFKTIFIGKHLQK